MKSSVRLCDMCREITTFTFRPTLVVHLYDGERVPNVLYCSVNCDIQYAGGNDNLACWLATVYNVSQLLAASTSSGGQVEWTVRQELLNDNS